MISNTLENSFLQSGLQEQGDIQTAVIEIK